MARILHRRGRAEAAEAASPHRWALSLWARTFRRLGRPVIVSRHVRRFCRPFTVEGSEHFAALRGSALIVANHTSHFDTAIVLGLLPDGLYSRITVAAAADRFYNDAIKGPWLSLRYSAYPIARGGGSAALAYSEWLLQSGWSILIFPEGHRSRTGELLPFHPGPAILALRQHVPVLPIYIHGAGEILQPGTKRSRPAPVSARIGEPLSLDGVTDVREANSAIEAAVRALAPQRAEPAAATV